jgi:hypothetical protein
MLGSHGTPGMKHTVPIADPLVAQTFVPRRPTALIAGQQGYP